jgi:hypothetical protein
MHSKEKRNRVIEWVKTHVCSIAFLQETHIDENIEKEIRNNSKFEIVSSLKDLKKSNKLIDIWRDLNENA